VAGGGPCRVIQVFRVLLEAFDFALGLRVVAAAVLLSHAEVGEFGHEGVAAARTPLEACMSWGSSYALYARRRPATPSHIISGTTRIAWPGGPLAS